MGDFHQQFHRPNAGSHTVEGNVSGSRAAMLERKRQAQQEEFEAEKQRKRKQAAQDTLTISSKFQPARIGSTVERTASNLTSNNNNNDTNTTTERSTYGLVTAQAFKEIQQEQRRRQGFGGAGDLQQQDQNSASMIRNLQSTTTKLKQQQLCHSSSDVDKKVSKKEKKKKKKEKQKMRCLLSFENEEEDEETSIGHGQKNDTNDESTMLAKPNKKSKISKDPTVDTSFLPDKQREEQEFEERIRLEIEWKQKQEEIQKETLEITYSYWDGSGHRRSIQIQKGASVGDFLELVRLQLATEFREMQTVAADSLLYVKEDLILPHDITFYDLIATKARGKSGPLFHFDVHDDIRVGPLDSRVEKDESHPGKVVERRWYERNKHIFPASRWEIYDPTKEYGTYTIHGGEVQSTKQQRNK